LSNDLLGSQIKFGTTVQNTLMKPIYWKMYCDCFFQPVLLSSRWSGAIEGSGRVEARRLAKFLGRLLAIGLLLALGPSPSFAQVETSFNGYAKNLGIRSNSFLTSDPYYLNISRGRVIGRMGVNSVVHAELWLDTELVTGSFLTSADFQLGNALERATLLDLDWMISSSDQHQLRQSLFRAHVSLYLDTFQLTAGRQRIAWGTGFVWNPTDILNPVNPTNIERDEKIGVDALYAVLPLGALSQIEAVWAVGRTPELSSYAARALFNVGDYDIAFTGGYFRESWVIGGDVAGYLGDAGLRGEWALRAPESGPLQLRAALNADYNFASGYYTLVELHYNSPGRSSSADYDLSALLDGTVFNLAELYSAFIVSKSLTPLISANMYSLLNLNDGSGLAGPAVTWAMFQNVELSLSSYLFFGPGGSEFGALSNAYFGSIQVYF